MGISSVVREKLKMVLEGDWQENETKTRVLEDQH